MFTGAHPGHRIVIKFTVFAYNPRGCGSDFHPQKSSKFEFVAVAASAAAAGAVIQMIFMPLGHNIVNGFCTVKADVDVVLRGNARAIVTSAANDTVAGVGILSFHS